MSHVLKIADVLAPVTLFSSIPFPKATDQATDGNYFVYIEWLASALLFMSQEERSFQRWSSCACSLRYIQTIWNCTVQK